MKKKIFVTGGNGFIGQSFCAAVCKKFNIVSFDLKIEESLKKFKNIKQVKGTILNELELYNAMNGCHYVVHLAAALGVENTETNRLECYKVNVEGTKNVLEAAFKRRIKKVVFSSSSEVYGDQGSSKIKEDINLRYMSNYAATKSGMYGFTRSLARELAKDNIRVNAISPGFVETDMLHTVPPDLLAGIKDEIPLGRFGYADEVALAVLYLCSPAASWVTGINMSINGGHNML